MKRIILELPERRGQGVKKGRGWGLLNMKRRDTAEKYVHGRRAESPARSHTLIFSFWSRLFARIRELFTTMGNFVIK